MPVEGSADPSTLSASPLVSVVIPTYNRRILLARCLDALALQTLPPERFEVIVVDDGSTDDTATRLAERARTFTPRLICLKQENAGPAAARNRGITAAQAPVIALTDDDAVPRPGWLAAGLAALDDQTVAAVEGRVTPGEGAVIHLFDAYLLNETGEKFVTCNMFYRTVVLRAVGGFDERFREAFREDSDLAFHCLERGFQIKFVPEVVVDHPPRPAGWGKFIRQAWLYRYDGLLRRKHPEQCAQRIVRSMGRSQTVFLFAGSVLALLLVASASDPAGALSALLSPFLRLARDSLNWVPRDSPLWDIWRVISISGVLGIGLLTLALPPLWWLRRESPGVRLGLLSAIAALAQFPIMAFVQGAASIVGIVTVWSGRPRASSRRPQGPGSRSVERGPERRST